MSNEWFGINKEIKITYFSLFEKISFPKQPKPQRNEGREVAQRLYYNLLSVT